MRSTKCIICYSDLPLWSAKKPPGNLTALLPDPEKVPGTEAHGQGQVQQKDLLSKHLDVIFILRNIFELPLNQLSFFLRYCPSIENWITTCANCGEIVKSYQAIYRKWQDAKSRLIKIVKDSYDKDHNDVETMVALDITNKCRQFINEYNYKGISNPFVEGDLRAQELLKSEQEGNQINLEETIDVKEELPELLHLSENNFEHLNDSFLNAVATPAVIESTQHKYLDDDGNHWDEDVQMENEDLSQQSSTEEPTIPTTTEPPQPHLPPPTFSKPIRKNIPRVAKRIAKTKTQNLLRKPDKSLIPPRPKKVKPPPKEPKAIKKKSKKGRQKTPKTYFIDQLMPEPGPADQQESKPEPPPRKFLFKDDLEDEEIPLKLIEDPYDDDFEISDLDAAKEEESSDFEISEDEEKPKKKRKSNKPTPKPSRKLKCPETDCTSEFDRRQQLNSHLLEIHNTSPKPPVTDPTKRKYPPECYSYSENRKRRFRVKIPSKCDLCLKTFVSQEGLRAHMRVMDELHWPHHCKMCGKGESSKQSLDKHEALCRTGEALLTLVTCPAEDCGLILSTTVNLETHYRHHHRTLETQPCTIIDCPERFFTEVGLKFHLQDKHKENKPFQCDHCSQGFTLKWKLEEHKKRVLEREAVEKDPSLAKICNHCGKTFINEASLNSHMKMKHEHKYLYPCEHCEKGYSVRDKLNIHLWKVHERRDVSLKFMCNVEGCWRICSGKKQFEAHKARHAGIPQFCCEECGKEFYEEIRLKEHVNALHESKKGDKVKCEVCGMEFQYWKYMIRHKKTVHENKKRRPKKKPDMEEQKVGLGSKDQVFIAAGQ